MAALKKSQKEEFSFNEMKVTITQRAKEISNSTSGITGLLMKCLNF